MDKRGYLKVDEIYATDFRLAHPYWDSTGTVIRHCQLDERSMQKVIEALSQRANYNSQHDVLPLSPTHTEEHYVNLSSNNHEASFARPTADTIVSHGTFLPRQPPFLPKEFNVRAEVRQAGSQRTLPGPVPLPAVRTNEAQPLLQPSIRVFRRPREGRMRRFWNNLKHTRLGIIIRYLLGYSNGGRLSS